MPALRPAPEPPPPAPIDEPPEPLPELHQAPEPMLEPSAEEPIRFAPSRPPPTHPAVPLRRQQILVATANPANRKIFGSILARGGYIVHFAEDADDARQGLEMRDVDALVIDLTGYAGADYGAARQCRRARPSLPIIGLTGDSTEIAERRGRAAGLDAVLGKPVERAAW
jgi:CheY-like chemotaxis protein